MKLQYLVLLLLCVFNFGCKDKDDPISEIKVEKITISGNDIVDGTTSVMVATVMPENAKSKDVVWSTSDETIADISAAGLLTARMNGTVIVKATATDGSGVEGTKQIAVSGVGIKVGAITVSGSDITEGSTTQMTAVVSPSDAVNKNITWSVSDIALASISASGMLTVKGNGNIIVTATATDGSGVMGTKTISVSSYIEFNKVDLILEPVGTVTGTVTVQIRNAADQTLGTQTIAGSSISSGIGWTTITFSPAIMLLPGVKYRIVVSRSTNGTTGSDQIFWDTNANGNDLYSPGQPSVSTGGWVLDFAFRTYSNNSVDQQQTQSSYGFAVNLSSPLWQEFVPTKK